MKKVFSDKMKENPIIAGIKDLSKLDDALESDCQIIFLLCGTIFNLKEITKKIKDAGKLVFIHVDLVEGFSRDATAALLNFTSNVPGKAFAAVLTDFVANTDTGACTSSRSISFSFTQETNGSRTINDSI